MTSLRAILFNIFFSASIRIVATSKVLEKLDGIPRGWTLLGPSEFDDRLTLQISLRQQNTDDFYETLTNISTYGHANYGHHLQRHEVQAMLKPTEETSDAVITWLQNANISTTQRNDHWIKFSTSVSKANDLLNAEFEWYAHGHTTISLLRTLTYSVPESVAPHINFIQPTTRFASTRRVGTTTKRLEDNVKRELKTSLRAPMNTSCNKTMTPECVLDLYNVDFKGNSSDGNKIAFASFLDQYARHTDMEAFQSMYANYSIGQNFTVVDFNESRSNETSMKDSQEANVDSQYILSIAYPSSVTEYSVGGLAGMIPDGHSIDQHVDSNEPFLEFLLELLALPNEELPQTLSISYGEPEQEVPTSYAIQVCHLFAQLGARGVSVLVSSGDFGTGDFCLSNDESNTAKFQPVFPASCPWVTSVGGTTFIEPEQAAFFSSGGFSNIWPRPAYQETAVREYLGKINEKNSGYYNRSGRGFPDVAAQSANFQFIDKGKHAVQHGTSCAAPVFAGIISQLNSVRLSAGLPPLGFLNPWIYAIGRLGLNDIVLGAGTGCNGNSSFNLEPNGSPIIPGASWDAVEGWDAVTGYGTPDFQRLLRLSRSWAQDSVSNVFSNGKNIP